MVLRHRGARTCGLLQDVVSRRCSLPWQVALCLCKEVTVPTIRSSTSLNRQARAARPNVAGQAATASCSPTPTAMACRICTVTMIFNRSRVCRRRRLLSERWKRQIRSRSSRSRPGNQRPARDRLCRYRRGRRSGFRHWLQAIRQSVDSQRRGGRQLALVLPSSLRHRTPRDWTVLPRRTWTTTMTWIILLAGDNQGHLYFNRGEGHFVFAQSFSADGRLHGRLRGSGQRWRPRSRVCRRRRLLSERRKRQIRSRSSRSRPRNQRPARDRLCRHRRGRRSGFRHWL